MSEPSIFLGIPLMDKDHAVLEDMLERVAQTSDGDLPALLFEIEAETRAHFEREEALMLDRAVPVMACHMHQHELLLSWFISARAAADQNDIVQLRAFLADTFPELMIRHINTADRVTAGLLVAMARVDA